MKGLKLRMSIEKDGIEEVYHFWAGNKTFDKKDILLKLIEEYFGNLIYHTKEILNESSKDLH